MLIGTGLQNKLLEAMAMQLPCITSPLVNNALGAKENKEILIGKNIDEYVQHILFLLNNPDQAKEVAFNGYSFVEKNYIWEKLTLTLERLISKT